MGVSLRPLSVPEGPTYGAHLSVSSGISVGQPGHFRRTPHEVRDGSVVDLLAALNTGHDGGCGTLHANSAADVPARVEALALAAGLGREATHAQLGSALDVVVHLERRGPRRLLREVAVPVRGADGRVEVLPAVRFDDDGAARRGPGARLLAERLG